VARRRLLPTGAVLPRIAVTEPGSPVRIDPVAAAGGVLVAGGIGWLILSASATGTDVQPALVVVAAAVASFLVAHTLTRRHGWVAPALIVLGSAVFAWLRRDVLFSGPHRAPLGYSNAAGTLYLLAVAAALLVALRADRRWVRVGAVVAACAFAIIPLLNNTRTAALLLVLLPVAFAASGRHARQRIIAASGGLLIAAFATTTILGATYRPVEQRGVLHSVVERTISERRLQLWHDAIVLTMAHPWSGVGLQQFPERSPTALANRDTPWPHNEAWHAGAELGVPGLLLMLGALAWPLAWLNARGRDRGAALGALTLGAVGVHSHLDYVLHSPAIPALAAALVAAGATLPRSNHRRGEARRVLHGRHSTSNRGR
jgi:O-antigen ligase